MLQARPSHKPKQHVANGKLFILFPALYSLPEVMTSDNVMIEDQIGLRTQRTDIYDASDGAQLQGKQLSFDRGASTISDNYDIS